MPKLDLTGQRFGRLIALKEAGRANTFVLWLCCCDCGSRTKVLSGNLKSGHSRSCGCMKGHPTHGHTRKRTQSATFKVWHGMFQRCYNPKNVNYKNYGGRDITICERWRKFENFLADMGERPPGLSIDRIDNDRGYFPGNCQWATRSQQNSNQRRHRVKA